MIKKTLLFLLLTLLTLTACQGKTEESVTEGGEAFELYLVANPQMTGPDLQDYALEDLPLTEVPLVKTEDIIQYNWDTHTLDLTEEAYQRLLVAFSGGMPMSGLPFVIVSNGERIYAGAFWSFRSSLSFDGVVIHQPMDPTSGTLLITLGFPVMENFSGQDPRSDNRLKANLTTAGVIKE